MRDQAWFWRLAEQCPGWHVWKSSIRPKWRAVPAPADMPHTDALSLPGQVSATTPAELRAAMRLRYGWDDHCNTCGVLARECGHRQPERG